MEKMNLRDILIPDKEVYVKEIERLQRKRRKTNFILMISSVIILIIISYLINTIRVNNQLINKQYRKDINNVKYHIAESNNLVEQVLESEDKDEIIYYLDLSAIMLKEARRNLKDASIYLEIENGERISKAKLTGFFDCYIDGIKDYRDALEYIGNNNIDREPLYDFYYDLTVLAEKFQVYDHYTYDALPIEEYSYKRIDKLMNELVAGVVSRDIKRHINFKFVNYK